MSNQMPIRLVPGNVAPRFADAEGLEIQEVIITEQGTASKLPIVDFVFKDGRGNQFVYTTTGRLVLGVAGAISGVNMRNHGKVDP